MGQAVECGGGADVPQNAINSLLLQVISVPGRKIGGGGRSAYSDQNAHR